MNRATSEGSTPDSPLGSSGLTGPTLADAALAELEAWRAPDANQERLRKLYVDTLRADADAVWKSGPPEHLTASCVVFDPALEHVLLTHHRKGEMWVQFGGHCERADASLSATALRELREESGIETADLVRDDDGIAHPLDLDRHGLGDVFGSCAAHLDVVFAAVVPREQEPSTSAESLDVRWFPLGALPKGIVSDLPGRLAVFRSRLAVR